MAGDASAFCRTASCPQGTGARCVSAQPDDCGIAIFWPKNCIGCSVQEDASKRVTLDAAEDALATAFGTWMSADCGGGTHPHIRVKNLGPVACDEHEYNQKK